MMASCCLQWHPIFARLIRCYRCLCKGSAFELSAYFFPIKTSSWSDTIILTSKMLPFKFTRSHHTRLIAAANASNRLRFPPFPGCKSSKRTFPPGTNITKFHKAWRSKSNSSPVHHHRAVYCKSYGTLHLIRNTWQYRWRWNESDEKGVMRNAVYA